MYGDHPPARTRAGSIAAVVAIHLVLGYALVSGLAVDFPGRVADSLHTFSLDVPPPPPVEPPRPKPRPATERAPKKEGAASPPNLTARATEVVAPPIVIPPPQPPPIVVAPKASTGAADHSGAAPIPGPGTGSGGIGEGTGSGRYGDGPGGGGGGEGFELISRNIRDTDFPRGMPDDGRSYRVRAKIIIEPNGRVGACTIVRASDSAALNNAICGVLRRRLRFRPSIDANGRPYADYAFWEHVWSSGSYEPEY
jgi:periplasmic protein TonB